MVTDSTGIKGGGGFPPPPSKALFRPCCVLIPSLTAAALGFLESLADDLEPLVQIARRHVEGRAESNGLGAAGQDQHFLVPAGVQDLVTQLVGHKVKRAHQALAARVTDHVGEFLLDLHQSLEKVRTGHVADVIKNFLLAVDLEVALGPNHVDDVATPCRVDSAGYREAVLLKLIKTGTGNKAADLGLLAEAEDIGLDGSVMLPGPHLPGDAHAALDFVEDQDDLVLVADLAQLLEERGPELVVPAFALDCFNDEGADVIRIAPDGLLDLADSHFLKPLHVGQVLLEGPCDLRGNDTWPVELCEKLVLVRVVCVGDGKGIAAAAMEGIAEMDDLGALLAVYGVALADLACLHKLADFPIHRGLECVFDSQGSVVDKERVVEPVGLRHFVEGLDEIGHFHRIDVGARDLVDRGAEDPLLEFIRG